VNLCTGEGHALSELIKAVQAVTGRKITVVEKPPREEKASIIGDARKAIALGLS
jgi:UDP-glucose 4-epimerase